jgi:hypothetical protein
VSRHHFPLLEEALGFKGPNVQRASADDADPESCPGVRVYCDSEQSCDQKGPIGEVFLHECSDVVLGLARKW